MFPANNETGLVIREGKALELKEPKIIELTGDINTVGSFLKKRYGLQQQTGLQTVDKNKAVVLVNKENMTITLKLDPENHYGATISGNISLSPELKQFCINNTKMFQREELVKLLRFSKMFFADADVHYKILTAYQQFKASAYVDMNVGNDQRGNKNMQMDKVVKTDLPDAFLLTLPIFKGEQSKTFRVEICLDVNDGGGRFWFESVELHELVEFEKERIITEQLESCADLVVIYE